MRTMQRIGLLVLATLFAGCGGGAQVEDDEYIGDSAESLSARSRTYVQVRLDARKCMAPRCGGYWVHDVNRVGLREVYVSDLDFAQSGLDAATIQKVREAPAGELVLRGKLGPVEPRYGTRKFKIAEAYRGMPGAIPETGALFYKASHRDPPIYCFAAPCNNLIAKKLNSTFTADFTTLSVAKASMNFVDQAWLAQRVLGRGAVVAAKFTDGQLYETGREKVLDASQVFLRLPDVMGPCPLRAEQLCGTDEVGTYWRTTERCLVFDQCVKPLMCTLALPNCDQGYSLISWRVSPSGCYGFACDPTFVVQ